MLKAGEDFTTLVDGELREVQEMVKAGEFAYVNGLGSIMINKDTLLWKIERLHRIDYGRSWAWKQEVNGYFEKPPLKAYIAQQEEAWERDNEAEENRHKKYLAMERERAARQARRDQIEKERRANVWWRKAFRRKSALPKAKVVTSD